MFPDLLGGLLTTSFSTTKPGCGADFVAGTTCFGLEVHWHDIIQTLVLHDPYIVLGSTSSGRSPVDCSVAHAGTSTLPHWYLYRIWLLISLVMK